MTDTSISPTARANWEVAELLIAGCQARGIDHVFIAPGSRCTPLTLAVAERSDLQVVQHFDERGLAFAALGYGRATGRPAAVICTSGTAVANLLPAVIEASLDHVPLLLLTADRPPELRDQGANQAIDQVKIFQQYVRWFSDLPCPAAELKPAFWQSQMDHALAKSSSGPVHLNCMFREPFGLPAEKRLHGSRDASSAIEAIERSRIIRPSAAWKVPTGNILVVAGNCSCDEARAAERMARRLQAPFFSDVSNGIRGDITPWQFARRDNPPPDVVIHVGQRVVTKRWWSFVEANRPRHYIHLTRFESRFDPIHQVTQTFNGCLLDLCQQAQVARVPSPGFRQDWIERAAATKTAVDRVLDEHPQLSEPWAARHLSQHLPADSGLFLGNSLPIRDWDSFGVWQPEIPLRVACNRGASGIDGLMATTVGFARGLGRRTISVVGDLSALHDLNSLSLMAGSPVPIVQVIMNNGGGGIFHFLPISSQTEHFLPYFVTPHDRQFGLAAKMFGLPYSRATNCDELNGAFREACQSPTSSVIEVTTDGPSNASLHRAVERAVVESSR